MSIGFQRSRSVRNFADQAARTVQDGAHRLARTRSFKNIAKSAQDIAEAVENSGIPTIVGELVKMARDKVQETAGNAVNAIGGQLANAQDGFQTMITGMNKSERAYKDLIEGKFFDKDGDLDDTKLTPDVMHAIAAMDVEGSTSLVKVLTHVKEFKFAVQDAKSFSSGVLDQAKNGEVSDEEWKKLATSKCDEIRLIAVFCASDKSGVVPESVKNTLFDNLASESEDSIVRSELHSLDIDTHG